MMMNCVENIYSSSLLYFPASPEILLPSWFARLKMTGHITGHTLNHMSQDWRTGWRLRHSNINQTLQLSERINKQHFTETSQQVELSQTHKRRKCLIFGHRAAFHLTYVVSHCVTVWNWVICGIQITQAVAPHWLLRSLARCPYGSRSDDVFSWSKNVCNLIKPNDFSCTSKSQDGYEIIFHF